jgi:hypothetical protein
MCLKDCYSLSHSWNWDEWHGKKSRIYTELYIYVGFTHINIFESAGTANNEDVYDQWVGNKLEGGVLGQIYKLNNHIFSR